MPILRIVAARLAFAIPQLFGIALVAFFLLKLIPGDPAPMMLGPLATQEAVDRLRAEMGLDQPLPNQFIAYLGRLLHGDLGRSWQTTNPVLTDIAQRLPATLELVTLSLVMAVAIGLPLGLFAGRKPDGKAARFADRVFGRRRRAARFLAGAGADLRLLQRLQLGSAADRPPRLRDLSAADRHRLLRRRRASGRRLPDTSRLPPGNWCCRSPRSA